MAEAGIETSNRAMVRSCREFVSSLLGDELGEESLKALAALYRPPKLPRGGRKGAEDVKRKQVPAWIAGLMFEDWDEETTTLARAEREAASARIADESAYRVDQFRWLGRLKTEWKRGDRVIQITTGPHGTQLVWPPGRILGVRKYSAKRAIAYMVSVELPKRKQARPLKKVRKLTGNPTELKGDIGCRRIRREAILAAIAALWNPK